MKRGCRELVLMAIPAIFVLIIGLTAGPGVCNATGEPGLAGMWNIFACACRTLVMFIVSGQQT